MNIEIGVVASFNLNFDRATVEALNTASQKHYDSHCRSYSGPDGLLTRYLRAHDNDFAQYGYTATWRDLDTLAKITEFTDNGLCIKAHIVIVRALGYFKANYQKFPEGKVTLDSEA